MKHVRQNRKTLELLKKVLGRPAVYAWTGTKAFNRIKSKKFAPLVTLLDDRQFQAFCSAIGFIEVNWAMMEQQLDGWVQLVFVTLENGKRKKHLPRGFGKKSEYLREAFNSIPELRPFSEDAISVLDRADGHADMRHDMTHAVITHMIPKNGKYELVNKKVQRDGSHVSKDVVFDVRGFPMLSEDLVDLAKDAIHLSARLQERFL